MKAEQSEQIITSKLREIVSGVTVRRSSDVLCKIEVFVWFEKEDDDRVDLCLDFK